MLKKWTLIVISFCQLSISIEFTNPTTGKNFSYIFVPGLLTAETQLARYMPEFIASTGQKITTPLGIHVINNPVSICTFPEINLKPVNENSRNPLIHATYYITNFLNKFHQITVTSDTPESDFTVDSHSLDISKLNFGQEEDINKLALTYQEHIEKYPNTEVIIYGTSRGAATTLNFIKQHPERVAAVILEAPFDSIPHLLSHKFPSITRRLINEALVKFTSYKPNGEAPIDNLDKVPHTIPVLIVYSDFDTLIHKQHPQRLARRLKLAGHPKTYVIHLKKSSHPAYAYMDQDDQEKYECDVHRFYKENNLPYNEHLAERGNIEQPKKTKI